MRFPVIVLILLFVFTACICAYILKDINSYASRPNRKRIARIFVIVMVLMFGVLALGVALPRDGSCDDVLPVMWIIFSYSTVLIAGTVYCLCSLIGRLINLGSRRLVNFGAMVGVPLAILVFLIMWWGVLYTRHDTLVRELAVESPRVPANFNDYTIVQISDAHVGTWGNDTSFISKLVTEINNLKPDAIVFTGDIVNRNTSELEPFRKVFARLKAKDGVFSILGNHDYGDYVYWESDDAKVKNLQKLKDWQTEMGWTMLNNSHAFLHRGNDSIAMIGVENWGEPPFKQYGNLRTALTTPDRRLGSYDDNFKILLTHNPMHWSREVVKKSNIDLTMSGHTHAMQMELDIAGRRFSPASWRYPEWGGEYKALSRDSVPMSLYVNIGCGEVGVPMRIGATPEITMIKLKSQDPRLHE